MKKQNPFHRFQWERDGNGNYIVTDKLTGESVIAIPRLERPGRYCIRESEEMTVNYYGQLVPKVYNRFEVMAFCEARAPRPKVHTHTREGFSDA